MAHCIKWSFAHLTSNFMTFIQAKPDTCIQSERHIIKNLTFYLECTPNGFSPQKIPKGNCVLWLSMALSELPYYFFGVNIKCKIFCQAIGYKAEGSYNKLGIQSYSFAIGPPYISFKLLKKKASWSFECHIDIQDIIQNNSPLNDTIISSNSISTQKAISWKFTDKLVNSFILAAPNTDISSELFSIHGCTFGLECTPNGYSGKVPVGSCGIWVALRALPADVQALQNVTLIAYCGEVNFEVSKMVNNWNVPSNNYVSIDFPKYINNVKFKYLSSWTFQCAIKIGNFIYYNKQNVTSLNSVSNVSMNNNLLAQQEQMTAQFLLSLLAGYQELSQNPMVNKLVNEGVDVNDAIKAVTMSSDNNDLLQDKDKPLDQMISYGFDKQTASIALDCCNHNIDQAIEFIAQQQLSLEKNNKQDLLVCDVDITECGCLNDLSNIMLQYDDSKDNYDHIRKEYNLIQIVDYYQHLLCKHDTDTDFEYIYNTLPKCVAKNCDKFRRNYRHRNNECSRDYRGNDAPLIQLLDKIHCYYKHTYQMGYRLTLKERNDINKECKNDSDYNKDEKMEHDKTFKPLQSILSKKKIAFPNDNGIKFAKYKYNQLQNMKSNDKMYQFGTQFFYADRGNSKANVFAKYYSLKEEMLNNIISNLNKQQYDNECAKAAIHLSSQYCRTKYCNIECPFTKKKVSITQEQLLALLIYCNYDNLQNKFSKTYRDNINQHNSFYYLAKNLSDAVNIFGDNNGKVNTFYHGISEQLSFPAFIGRYNSIKIFAPLSTSSEWEVALNFSFKQGLIIEFGPPPVSFSMNGESCRRFPTSWISDYGNEKEHLFIQNQCGLTINSITDAFSGNSFKMIINGLKAINCAIQRHMKIQQEMNQIALLITKHQLSKKSLLYKKLPRIEYAETMINTYCQNIKDVEIDFGADVNENNANSSEEKQQDLKTVFTDLFYDKHNEKCDIYLLECMFPNMRSLSIKNANLNFRTLEDIARKLGDKSALSMLKVIEIYPHKTCKYDMELAVQKYGERFKQIQYEMKLQSGGLCFLPPDFDQAAYNTWFEIMNLS